PESVQLNGLHAHRQLTLGHDEFDFSTGFDDLHYQIYRGIVAGNGFGIGDARDSIELVHRLRTAPIST
ncbi:MAG: oxidoreductase, partial [Bradymonadia bacterium]